MDTDFRLETGNRFNGLSEDNKKLINDLISFDKCLRALTKFKAFIDLISDKIKTNLDSNELKRFEELNKEVDDVFKPETDLKEVPKNVRNSTTDCSNELQFTPELKSEPILLSDENGVQHNHVINKISSEVTDDNCPPNGFPFDVCEKVLNTENSLIVHKKGVHLKNQKFFFCDNEYCNYKTISEYHLMNHKNQHKALENFKCNFDVCGEVFNSEESLNQHFKKEHNITKFRYNCYYSCGKRFPMEYYLKEHVERAHRTTYKPFKCKVLNCHKMFRFECKLRLHHKIVHQRKYGCPHPECDFFARSKPGFQQHLDSHSKFKCAVEGCDQTFVQKLHLKDHHSTAHPSQMVYFCEWKDCNKSFRTEGGYNQHSIKHTDIEFTCEWPGCEFTTKIKNGLRRHQITHSSESNFSCDWPECGKRFKTKDRLENHLRIHYNDKRYACHWPGCQYRCSDSANLCKHVNQVHKRKIRSQF